MNLTQLCRYCCRPLRSLKSMLRGYGPICGKRDKGALARAKLLNEGNVELFDLDGNPAF